MFTSGINIKFLKTSFIYLCVSLFLILFGAIYEYYSHGVYSYFMIYAFCLPLVFGALTYFVRALLSNQNKQLDASDFLYCGAITAFTAGSIMKGVLDIFGTTNANMKVYPVFGGALLVAAIILKIIKHKKA
ncbi:MAG: hypothetical protein J6T73_03275 [Clostridia bacterium]|nr:hypothetical protein [Clostridia bacterium]